MIRGRALAAIALLLIRCTNGVSMSDPPLLLDVIVGIPEDPHENARALMHASRELSSAFASATRLYESGRHAWAGDAFMSAARAARGFDELAENRSSCYRNAARAWVMAGSFGEKRALLEEAAREDPLCAADIRDILDILTD